jgi:Trypsin
MRSVSRSQFDRRNTAGKLAILLPFCFAVSLIQPAGAVSNGLPVTPDDPIRALTVSVYSALDDCTGVKIASNLVLTAKHCELDKSTRVYFADGRSFRLTHIFLPDERPTSGDNEYDLAIIRIDGEVPGSAAQIADEATTPQNESTAWIAGYGGQMLTKANNPLRKIEVEMTDKDYSPSAVLVRTNSGGGVCDGDSGGPGYTQVRGQIVVWGIDSGSLHGDDQCASREIYAKVAAVRDWIEATIADNGLKLSAIPEDFLAEQLPGRSHPQAARDMAPAGHLR